ncbi:hypothetical protein HY030_00610 [Candidatus Gottesmanbacteria bacterium]|nr:hypothetical protein [Candidatus Gottesmanbacteria bacterium]
MPITIKKIFTSEIFFLILVIIIGMGASLYPMFYELIHRHNIFPDREFVLVYNFAPDFNAYLSKIIQGIQGKWSVVEYFTSEAHKSSLLQIFYLISGRAGGLFSSNPEFTYHAIRIIFGIGWIITGWFFIKYSFTSKFYRKIALLFFVFGGNFPKLVKDTAGYGFPFLGKKWEPWIVGWSNLDPVKRMTFIPHWNAGHVLTVLSLLCFIRFISLINNQNSHSGDPPVGGDSRIRFWTRFDREARRANQNDEKKRIFYLIISILIGILAGLSMPPTLIIVYAILGLWMVWSFFLSLRGATFSLHERGDVAISLKTGPASAVPYRTVTGLALSPVFFFLLYFLLTFPTLLYNLWVTQFYPWKSLVETDLYVNKIVFPYADYLMGLGPLGFLGILGAVLVLIWKKEKLYWSAFWVLGMFSLIIFFDKFINWHDQTRFLEVGPELPLAILAVFSSTVIFRTFGKFREIAVGISCLAFMILATFLFAISLKAQTDFIDHKMLGAYPELSLGNYVVYPYKTIMEGVYFIKNNASFDDVTLSGPVVGNHIGAYAGRFVYIGHGSQTVRYYNEKLPKVKQFYAGLIGEKEVKVFLAENRIKYVFYGPEEKRFGDYPIKAEFLKRVFENKDVLIYKTNF